MFAKNNDSEAFDLIINKIALELQSIDHDSDEYDKLLSRMERVVAMQSSTKTNRVSPDTKVMVLGNLAGIAMIVGFERAHVVTSKALGFVMKLR